MHTPRTNRRRTTTTTTTAPGQPKRPDVPTQDQHRRPQPATPNLLHTAGPTQPAAMPEAHPKFSNRSSPPIVPKDNLVYDACCCKNKNHGLVVSAPSNRNPSPPLEARHGHPPYNPSPIRCGVRPGLVCCGSVRVVQRTEHRKLCVCHVVLFRGIKLEIKLYSMI